MDGIGVGVIGCGNMGKGLARGVLGLKEACLVAAADTRLAAARELADSVAGAVADPGASATVATYDDPARLLADERVQAVIIATPPDQHRGWIQAAAHAGKHVFAEKPLAPSVADCDAILETVEEAGVRLMVGQVCRFHAVHRHAKQLVDEGAIGRPACLTIHRLSGPWGNVGGLEWRLSRGASGGTLMEINAHEIDWARWVMGEARQVFAVGGNYLNPSQDYPDIVLLTLSFEEGGIGCLHSSQASALGGYGARIDGPQGSLVIPAFWGEQAGLQLRTQDGDRVWVPAADLPSEPAVQAELGAFISALQRDQEPPITGRDGRMAVAIAEAGYRSIESGRPEAVR